MDTDKIYIAFLILLIISYFVLTYIFRNKKNDKVQSKKLNIFFVLYILFYIYFGFVNYKDNDNTLAVKTKLLRKLNNEKINDKNMLFRIHPMGILDSFRNTFWGVKGSSRYRMMSMIIRT